MAQIDRESNPTLDEWLSAIEGTHTPQAADGRDVVCDYCRTSIEPNTPITNYVSTKLVNEEYVVGETEGFHFLRVYCEECDRQEIKYPCKGYTELLLSAFIDEQKRLQDISIVDVSTERDGIPFDPKQVWEVTHPDSSWEEFNIASSRFSSTGTPIALGPGDIIDDILFHGIDPDTVFTITGEIITDGDEIREKLRER